MKMRRLKLTDVLSLAMALCILTGVVIFAVVSQIEEGVTIAHSGIVVNVYCLNEGAHRAGDEVSIYAQVNNAHTPYRLTWQYNDGTGWKDTACHGHVYTYELTRENAAYSYRAVVTTDGEASIGANDTETLINT